MQKKLTSLASCAFRWTSIHWRKIKVAHRNLADAREWYIGHPSPCRVRSRGERTGLGRGTRRNATRPAANR